MARDFTTAFRSDAHSRNQSNFSDPCSSVAELARHHPRVPGQGNQSVSRKDTILIVSTSFPTTNDGSEAAGAFVADFVDELTKLAPTRVVGPGTKEAIEHTTAPVWRFAAGDKPLSLLSPLNPLHWIPILRTLRSLHRQVAAACADGRVRHILALWVLPSGWAARSVARRLRISYSVWALGSDIWSLGKLPIVRNLLGRIGKDASFAFADGIQLGKDAETLCHRPFEFLPSSRKLSGVRSRPVATEPPYRLLFLGRWHSNKGIDLLLEALHLLDDEDWKKIEEVHIAGGGPLEHIVQQEVEKLRLAGRPLRLSGYQSKSEAEEILSMTDWLLIPSRIESIPVVLSDSIQMQTPTITTATGDIPRIVSLLSPSGIQTNEISPQGFSQAIKSAIRENASSYSTATITKKELFSTANSAINLLRRIGAR